MTTTVRLPLRIEQTLAEYCVASRKTKSEVIVEALDRLLNETATAKKKSPFEIATEAGYIGCFEGSGETGNYKERAKRAIRAKGRSEKRRERDEAQGARSAATETYRGR